MNATLIRMSRRAAAIAALWLIAPLTAGCGNSDTGPKRVYVTGTITIDGEPLSQGMVSFFPDESVPGGHSATAHLQPDGTYSLGTFEPEDGVIPGRFRVAVLSYESDFETGESTPLIPERYLSVDESGLTAHVLAEPEHQVFNFQLQRP